MTARDAALAEHLVRAGLIRVEAIDHARERQGLVGGRLDSVLLDLGLVGESALLEALSELHNAQPVGHVELDAIEPEVARLITPRIAARFELAPFRREGNRLHVAAVSPGDLMVEDELALLTGSLVTSHVASEARLYEVLARFYGVERSPLLTRVARKLRGEAVRPGAPVPTSPAPPTVRHHPPEQPPAAPTAPPTDPPNAAGPVLRPRRAATEVELSTEDLELFPSLERLRSTGEGAGAADRRLTAAEPTTSSWPPPPAPPAHEPLPPPERPRPATPEERLALAADALQDAEMREDIADVLLDFCEPYLRRRMVLAVRKDTVIGWRGEGEGVDPELVRAISIPLSEPSVFVGLSQGMTFWLGALPPMPRNLEVATALGGERPRDCVILPVTLKQRTVCFIYGDNLEDGVGGVPVSAMRRLAAKAGLAFQVYLMKGKIRTL